MWRCARVSTPADQVRRPRGSARRCTGSTSTGSRAGRRPPGCLTCRQATEWWRRRPRRHGCRACGQRLRRGRRRPWTVRAHRFDRARRRGAARATRSRRRRRGPTSSRRHPDRPDCGRGQGVVEQHPIPGARERRGVRAGTVAVAPAAVDDDDRGAVAGRTCHPESRSPSLVRKLTSWCGTEKLPVGVRNLCVDHSAAPTGVTT